MANKSVYNTINQLQTLQADENLSQDSFINRPVENIVRPPENPEDKGFFEGTGKAFKVFLDDNTVLSTTRYIQDNGFNIIPEKLDPNYNPFDDIPEDKLDFVENYKYANTPAQVEKITSRINRELENRRILDEEVGTGAALVGGLFAGVTDPINLIPVGGELYKSYKFGKITQGAARAATAGFVSQTAAEGILQAEQETRSFEESAFNIGTATLFSGILGAGAALLTREKFNDVGAKFNKDITSDKADIQIDPVTQEIKTFSTTDLVKDIDPDVQKTIYQFLSKNKTQSLSENDLLDLSVRRFEIEQKLADFDNNRFNLFSQKLRDFGYPVDVIEGYKQKISDFEKERLSLREQINPGKTGKRLRLFDEETETKLKELNSELDFIKTENDQGKFNQVSALISKERKEILKSLKEIETSLENASNAKKDILQEEAIIQPESELKIEQTLPLVEMPEPIDLMEPRSIGSAQNIPYQDLYNKYLEDNLPTGKQPLTYREFRNGLESLVGGVGGSAGFVAKSLNKINPILRTFYSKSVEAKNLLQELATHNMILGKNEAGIATQQSVENSIKFWRGGLGDAISFNNRSFKEFKSRMSKDGIPTVIKTQADWNIEVSKAMRRGDVSDIPEIQKAAQSWRSQVFDPLKNAAITEKLLPEDVRPETAVSYLSRLWDKQKIIAYEPDLRQIISSKLINYELPRIEAIRQLELTKLANKVAQLEKKGDSKELASAREKFNEERIKFDADFEDKNTYVKEIVDSILTNLKGEQRFGSVSNYDFKITSRGPLKERTLNFIRDEEVESFLENDVQKIADRYTRIMGTDVELARKFEGDLNLEKRLAKVKEEYENLAELAKTEKQRLDIQKEKLRTIQDLEALRDIMRGIYATPENPDGIILRGFRVARQLNYATKLGGVVLSSLADTTTTIGIHGMGRFSSGLKHVFTNLKGIRLNVKEAKRAGNILENVLHSRLATMAELTDPLNSGNSRFERFVSNVANLGTRLNGMSLWNDTMKGFASVLTQQRLINESKKLLSGKITKKNRTYLAFLGIDETGARAINDQLEKFATKESGLWVANTQNWTNQEAVRLYRNALNQDVDRTIVTKNAGDVPLFMNTELGKTIGQFKSFTFASTQQVLINRLQQADAAALNGFIAAVSMGMMVYYIKSIAAGKEPETDPSKLIAEGIDRSGMLGIIMEINGVTEKVTRGTIGINALTGGEMMSRYASRGIVDSLAGPTAGQIKDLSIIAAAISSGEIKESDVKAFRRMLPYQNVFYMQKLFDGLEQNINDAIVE